MKDYRTSSEDEMILLFLRAELSSERFSQKLCDVISQTGADRALIDSADLRSARENALRREIMKLYRGYGAGKKMFENFPRVERWVSAVCEKSDLEKMRYIDYDYWNELSENTSLPSAAARSVRNGRTIFGVPNDSFLAGARYLRNGGSFMPVILLTFEGAPVYAILEGHSRMTVYALEPDCFEGSGCIIGYCDRNELKIWNGKI